MLQYLTAGKVVGNPSLVDLNDLSWLIDQNLNEIEKKITMLQIQEVTPVIENGEQEHMHHVQGLESNMDTKQKKHWSMEFINGAIGDGMLCLLKKIMFF